MSYHSSKSSKIYLLCLWLTLTLATLSAAQTLVIPGGTVIDGNVIVPAPPQAPPAILPFLFGMEEHSISTPAAYPTIPFGAYRQYGTNCQWNGMWTGSGDNYNFACFGAQLAYADSFNVPLMFTFGQVPSVFSTINPDNTSTVPAQFPVAINGVTLNCTSGSCSATVTTLQRQNVAVGDSLTLTGAVGCPESPNGTFNATVANNPTDYPWTYTFNIGAGSTSSSACGGNAMFLADNAQKASLCSGTPAGPTQAGGCYSPADIDINGVGTDAHLISFLTQLLAYDAANDPHHRLAYIEVWNEPQGRGFFNGSIAQTARMAKDMYTVIQASAVASFVQLTSPAPSGGLTSPANYLGLYAADPSNPLQYACCINNHTYNFPAGAGTPDPMSATTIAANVRAAVAPFPAAAGKPQFATEGSWGFGPFGASSTNIGPNTGTAAGADKAGWASVAYMAHQCAGYKVYMFFAWDQMCNTGLACATPPPPFSISPAGIAYGITHDVLTGTTVSQTCTKDTSNNWTLNLQRGTYNVKALWNLNLTSLGSYTIPAGVYSDYRDVSGNVNSIGPTQTTVPVQYDPIFLETGNPPFFINSPAVYLGTVGVTFSGNVTIPAGVGTAPISFKERTLPSTLAAIGLSLNSATGAITGTPSTVGSFQTQIGSLDANGLSYAKNITISISNGIPPLTVTSGLCGGGTVGNPYSCSLTATGGTPPYTWSLLTGNNPAGTSLVTTSNVGIVSGTPTTAATYTPVYQVADSTTPTPQTATTPVNNIVISPSAGACGPPGYICTSRSTLTIQNPPAPFSSSSPVNTVAYDTSLNPSGTDPIVRLTDPTVSLNSLQVTPTGGANDNIWNLDSTMIFAYESKSGTGFIMGFDPSTTGAYTGVRSSTTYGGFWTWSKTDPHVGYSWRKNGGVPTLFRETCSAPNACVETTVMTSQAACPTPLNTYSPGSMAPLSVSKNDDVFGMMMNDTTQNSGGYVVTYKVSTNSCHWYRPDTALTDLGTISDPSCTFNVHAGFIFGNGLWQQISHSMQTGCPGGANSTDSFWQIGTTTVNHCNDAGGNALTCEGHAGPGYAIYTIYNDPHWNSRNPATVTTVNVFFTWATLQDSHLSQNNVDVADSNPIVADSDSLATPWTNPYQNEIFGISRTGALPARFTHNFSTTWTGGCGTCDFRDVQGIGSVSQDGKFFAFTSDMLLGLGMDAQGNQRTDIFTVALDYVNPAPPPLLVTNAPCTGGIIGAAYSCTLTATGGVPPYTWTLNSGSNPAGTSLTNVTNTGVVSGTLTGSPATYTPVYKVTDSAAATALAPSSGTYTIVITAMGSAENLYCGTGNIANFGSDPGPTTLPQSCINTARANTPSTGTVRTATNSTELTTDLAASACNDVVELLPGTVYTGNFTIPNPATCAANQWITIRTQNWLSAGPAEGVRVSPCWAGISSLPGRPPFNCTSVVNRMAQIITTSTTAPLTLAAGANHIRIEGVEITRSVGGTNTVSALLSRVNCSVASPCSFIILDQVWGHGTANDETTRMMSWDNISFAAAVNGFYSDFHCASVVGTCTDSQTFSGGLNTGTTTACFDHAWKHYNNYLESAGETFEYGGGAATTTPCDIEDRGNWMFKPLIWNPVDASYIPPTGGHAWVIKNHWESKNGTRALIEGNVLQNVWGGFSQVGAAVLWTPKSQSAGTGLPGLCPLCFDSNFTFRYNRIISSNQPFQIDNTLSSPCTTGCFAAGGNTYSVHDNVADNIGWADANNSSVPPWSGATDPVAPSNDYLHDLYVFHNTFVYPTVTAAGIWPNSMTTIDGPLGAVLTNIVTRDNIIASGQFGLTSIYTGTNRCAFGHSINTNGGGPTWLPACWGGASTFWDYNCIIGGNTNVSWIWPGTAGGHNVFPTNYAGVAFTNYNSGLGGNYSLQVSSPCHNTASDGTDMGANITTVNTYTTGVDQFGATLLSTVPLLTNPNTPTCTGNGIPDAGCNAAFTALSTDGANTNAQTQVIGPTPGNMSTLPTRNYLYSGATTKVRAYYQPWFRNDGGGSHINIGMDESNPATIAQQAAAMVAMGVDVINIDYYGTAATHAFLKTVTDAWTTYLTANPSVSLKQEIMLDQGALLPFCTDTLTVWSGVTAYTTGQGVTFSGHSYIALSNNTNKQPDTNPTFWQVMETCILNAMETQLDTIDSAYGSKSTYSKDSSGRPFLFLFITPANWANTDFAGTIYPAFLTYAHGHYTGRVYQVMDRFGAFGANFDGEYAWIQPPLYVNASPTSQKCWDDIVGGACNWATGVGGGTSYLNTFYTACRANPTKHCVGMLSKGFDWTHANWLTSPKIVQQGLANVPQLMAAKVAANGYSSSSQLEGIGWVTWNDYEEETAMEMGIDNGARPTVSISAPNQLGWLENPTDPTFWSEATIDHWEIWYANTGSPNLIQAFTGIAPSVSTEIISTLVPVGTHDVYLYMVGKPGIMNRLAGPVSYTH